MALGAISASAAFPPPGGLPPVSADAAADPLTAQAIRKAEAAVAADLQASPLEAARARNAVDAARALAARGAPVAARLMAEQAARQAAPGDAGAPGGGPGATDEKRKAEDQPGRPGKREEPQLTYQDASRDPNASMQYPTAMTPGQAAIMVPEHERGHIIHALARAMASGREVVQAYTVVHYRMDPNTGELVAAGGQAVVKTRPKPEVPSPFLSRLA
jgi:hypothetical protein